MIDFHIESDADANSDLANNNWSYATQSYDRQRARKIYKKDFTSRVGSLKKVSVFGLSHNKVHETINHYLHDDLANPADFEENRTTYSNILSTKFNNQGVIEETFADGRLVQNLDQYEMLGLVSKSEHYPAIQTGTTTINYRTGITTTTRNLGFDFYSGQITEAYSDDGYGNQYVSKNIPAYRYYPQMAGKNMLTQEGTSYSYLMNDGFDPYTFTYLDDVKTSAKGLVAASAQSWSNTIPSDGWKYQRYTGYLEKAPKLQLHCRTNRQHFIRWEH